MAQEQGSSGEGLAATIQKALQDLQQASGNVGEEVQVRIDSAMTQLQDASQNATAVAQSQASSVGAQLEQLRGWIQDASEDLLTEVQTEIDKRRVQLGLGGSDSDKD